YMRSHRSEASSYLENITQLRHLKQLDAEWDSDLLKSRIGINANYDPLAGSFSELSALLRESASVLGLQPHEDPRRLARSTDALLAVVEEKAALVERFKSANAVLRNSLIFLPISAQEVQETLGQDRRRSGGSAGTADVVNEALLAVMLYSQEATDERAAEIGAALRRLDAAGRDLRPELRAMLRIFNAHIGTVLREQKSVNELIRAIALLPTASRIDEIDNLLSAEQQRNSVRDQRNGEYQAAFSVLLACLLCYAALRLVRGHRLLKDSRDQLLEYGQGLEVMVADRVAALRESEASMTRLAQYDSLTGLPNRILFRDRLTQALSRARRGGRQMALMFVDLDHFKQINDSLGHAVGDEVLKAVAQRLCEALRGTDTISRLGGDEFTVIAEDIEDAAHAELVAGKLRQALALPLLLGGRELVVSASIGVALHRCGDREDDVDGESLLQAADIAMYRAKQTGRNAHAMFEPAMAQAINDSVTMGGLLRQALERGEFELHYQPKLDLGSGRIAGVEALLRWNSRELGPVSPAAFVPLAEELGLIVPIGEWVLRTACRQGQAWRQAGMAPLTMAVNLSPRQLRDPCLIDKVSAALRDTRFPPELLELELTEGLIMEDVTGNGETLAGIRRLGASLAIDDFGTGYSSLAYLSRLPVQTLKIDRAFVAALDSNGTMLVATMVTLAHSLNLKVVAEGVETLAQLQLLGSLGCDQIQGYHYSRPLPAAAFETWASEAAGRGPVLPGLRSGDAGRGPLRGWRGYARRLRLSAAAPN
ncbi:MAG: EAL domain-containing protein, partial [Burkholderiaceae bacterium]